MAGHAFIIGCSSVKAASVMRGIRQISRSSAMVGPLGTSHKATATGARASASLSASENPPCSRRGNEGACDRHYENGDHAATHDRATSLNWRSIGFHSCLSGGAGSTNSFRARALQGYENVVLVERLPPDASG